LSVVPAAPGEHLASRITIGGCVRRTHPAGGRPGRPRLERGCGWRLPLSAVGAVT